LRRDAERTRLEPARSAQGLSPPVSLPRRACGLPPANHARSVRRESAGAHHPHRSGAGCAGDRAYLGERAGDLRSLRARSIDDALVSIDGEHLAGDRRAERVTAVRMTIIEGAIRRAE